MKKFTYGYMINFNDNNPPEYQLLGQADTEKECEQIGTMLSAIAYSGSRPIKDAVFIWTPTHPHHCEKVAHSHSSGYLHSASDDGPYDVDGINYCGRCHQALAEDQ